MNTESCAVCSGKLVTIRGRYPREDDRLVCPTCLAERMDQIREIAHPDYGRAFQAGSDVALKPPAPLPGATVSVFGPFDVGR